ncbi:type I-E CRISPR-associated protein Cas7/Cse4/CasC [Syntrophorhabdus aromaticivorans]|uniref:type I-E CRISPR-associated protein Cas7/Cse4/CasC n=1 Tax=Syntrophorhabdus aromaticivorans TaxID=328301 RepID=UPI0004106AF6|nr:type I-E CRISPR-associated protein Cas7/Cse4/CasC [Syntrophorhabdus aromaticivorans]
MLIEVHMIQNHAPSNLNRDESGSPKSAYFGGYRRARISSQCLKRTYRTSKTFRNEVDSLGMHTRSMPEEIKHRFLAHADSLTGPDQTELQAKFKDWAEKSQAKLGDILGKGGKKASAEEPDEENEPAPTTAENESSTEAVDKAGAAVKNEKYQTAQSVFWREAELKALFDAYRLRIEWDKEVPDSMRTAFDNKGKIQPEKMIDSMSKISDGALAQVVAPIRSQHEEDSKSLNKKFGVPNGETEKAKKEREKKLKDAKAKNDANAANKLAQLILEHFDPKVVLKEAGLRPDGVPVDMALFGRMIANPLMHNIEASSQFSHAISTHEFAREFDLWTRVDDRRDKRLDWYLDAFGAEEKLVAGTDGMGDAEFTSACFYTYFNVDFDALVNNLIGTALDQRRTVLEEDQEKAKKRACNAVIGLVKAAILERPTGKFNSMATPSLPTLVLVEVRDSHVSVSYADAFAKPVDPKNDEKQSDTGQVQHMDLRIESAKRLIQEANRITRVFNRGAKARLLFTGDTDIGITLNGMDTKANNVKIKEGIANTESSPEVPFTPIKDMEELERTLRKHLGCPLEKTNG